MKYHWSDAVNVGGMQLPAFRISLAIQNGIQNDILIRTWGGLGDQICAEPTIRYALKTFKHCRFWLASEAPWLFEHLKFEGVFHLPHEIPDTDQYLLWDTIPPPEEGSIHWQFGSHNLIHCVDFSSISALRGQLPVSDREIMLKPKVDAERLRQIPISKYPIYVHAGKHWASKTFPKDWWDAVLRALIESGVTPILIGKNPTKEDIEIDPDAENRGTVDVNSNGCIDLRNRLSAMESTWLLQSHYAVLLTNDSSPLHMAASGQAWIGFIATCKHPDFITHWRQGQWGWRMKNFGKGGVWDHVNYCPNQGPNEAVTYGMADEAILRSWLPDPKEFAEWAHSRREAS